MSPSRSGRWRRRSAGPDRGGSWLIAFACCFINMMFYGMARMSGILFVASVERFGISRQTASFPYTLSSCVRNLSGPLVGFLGHRFGVRKVVICGAIVASLGIAFCFMAESIHTITILWGVIFGIGFGMGNIILPVSINQYFDKHRGTASGISFSGGCFGSFLLPPIVELLLDAYGLPGTFLVLSGLVLNCVPAALLLRKPDFVIDRSKKERSRNSIVEKQTMVTENLYTTNNVASEKNSDPCRLKQINSLASKSNLNNLDANASMKNNVGVYGSNLSIPYLPYQGPPNEWALANPMLSYDERFQRLSTQTLLSDYSIRMSSSEPLDCELIIGNSKGRRTVLAAHSECETCSVVSNLSDPMHHPEKVTFDDVFDCSSAPGSRKSSQLNGTSCDEVRSVPDANPESGETGNANLRHHPICAATELSCKDDKNKSPFCKTIEFPKQPKDAQNGKTKEAYSNLAYQDDVDETIKRPSYVSNKFTTHNNNSVSSKPASKPPKSCLQPFTVFLDPIFNLITITYALYCFQFVAMITVCVDFARDIGIHPSKEKYIIMSLSVGDLIGRLGLGWITDKGYMTRSGFSALCFLCQAATTAIVFSTGFPMLLVMVALYGLSEAGLICVFPLIIAELIDEDKQTVAISSSTLLSGPACLAVAPLIGFFREKVGSYNGIFYLVGITSLVCSLIWLLVPHLAKCRRKRNSKK